MRHRIFSHHVGEHDQSDFVSCHLGRSHLAATRMAVSFGPSSSSTSNATQDSGTASGGSAINSGIKNRTETYFGNYTNQVVKNDKKNSDNVGNVIVKGKGSVTYTTNGLDAGTLAAFGNSIAALGSGGGGGGGGGIAPVVYNTPAPSSIAANGTASSIQWGILGGVAIVLGLLFFLFKGKKS